MDPTRKTYHAAANPTATAANIIADSDGYLWLKKGARPDEVTALIDKDIAAVMA